VSYHYGTPPWSNLVSVVSTQTLSVIIMPLRCFLFQYYTLRNTEWISIVPNIASKAIKMCRILILRWSAHQCYRRRTLGNYGDDALAPLRMTVRLVNMRPMFALETTSATSSHRNHVLDSRVFGKYVQSGLYDGWDEWPGDLLRLRQRPARFGLSVLLLRRRHGPWDPWLTYVSQPYNCCQRCI